MTNRLQSALPDSHLAATLKTAGSSHCAAANYTATQGELHAALFAPLHYEANYAYPLLVWLHGPDDNEGQLKRVMPLISMRNYVAVAPRGTQRNGHVAARNGYHWSQEMADWSIAEQRIFDAMELAVARFHISPRRVFLAGYDCGGTMAFRVAMDHPDRFAGVLSLSGRFPDTQTPLRRLSDARRVPLFLACGRDSRNYATLEVCNNLKLFHSAGMNVSLRQYPCGHEIVPAMLADMDRWMMEQVSSDSATAVNSETSAL
jgi:phospholipase/carboxylesterase